MPDQNQQFEQQLKEIHEDAMRRKEQYEGSNAEQESSPERRALHEAIGERIRTGNGSEGPGIAQGGSRGGATDEPASYQRPELREDVQELVNTAFEKDISTAIEEAKKRDNPALLDAFHDALVDYLYDHLVERGKLEKLK